MKLPALAILSLALAGGCRGVVTGGGPGGGGTPGGPDGGDVTPPPCDDCTEGLFPQLPAEGSVPVLLHPGDTVALGEATLVPFAVPFPPGTVDSADDLRVTVDGGEVPARVEEIARWRSLSGGPEPTGVRAARVWIEIVFADRSPRLIAVEWGRARQQTMPAQGDVKDRWVPITEGPYSTEYPASENIQEPAVYATLSPDWLGACLVRSRSSAVGDSGLAWFDEFLVGASHTAVNDLPATVETSSYIDYLSDESVWLFDRPMTLWGTYTRTGDVRWLRHAHRATQFYANHVTSGGYFDMKDGDLKYSYGQAMLVDMMLTGDTDLVDEIEAVAGPAAGWDATYDVGDFWTERHQTYALLGVLSAWEATGSSSYGDRATAIANATFDRAQTPANGWTKEGCVLHSYADHEGGGSGEPVCSPWMSALLSDAVWRYYLHARDQRALTFLAELAEFVAERGVYEPGGDIPGSIPYYLVSSRYSTGPAEADDMEHACDVWGLVVRGAWARRALGGDPAALLATADSLRASCEYVLGYWHRDTETLPEYRLTPPRKYNWWFGTTTDVGWLLSDLAN